MKWACTIIWVSWSFWASGQMVISSTAGINAAAGTHLVTNSSIINQSAATKLQNLNLVLSPTGNSPQSISSTGNPLSIANITIASKATYNIIGDWTVTNDLTLTEGVFIVDNSGTKAGTLTYTGAKNLVGKSESYINGRIYLKGTAGLRTFPVGNSKGYFPAQLDEISPADVSVPLGFGVVSSDPTAAPAGFTISPTVKAYYKDHYWELLVGGTGNNFSGNSRVGLSGNQTNTFFVGDGDPVVIEKGTTGTQKDLKASTNNTFYSSDGDIASGSSGSLRYYALAKADEITLVIHKLITPDKNDTNESLFIEGIDAFPENEVSLLDRWGVVTTTWKGFKNNDPKNFLDLPTGNYICIVKYKRNGEDVNLKPQMISVLK